MGMDSVVAAHALVWLAAGCTAVAGDAAPPLPPGAAPGLPPSLLAAVHADAARRVGVPSSAVQVLSVQAVTWPDGSLGCPQPGMAYTQALVPGWQLLLSAGGRQLDYHASRRGGWLWCPAGHAVPPVPGSGAI